MHSCCIFVSDTNLVFNKATWQSTTKTGRVSSRAVDGNDDGHISVCTHTDFERVPWFLVDLEQHYLIQRVQIKKEAIVAVTQFIVFTIA